MRKQHIRPLPLLLALTLFLSLAIPAVQAAEKAEDTIYLSSADDLRALAKNCTLDTWSQGKTVVLQRDLNLEGIEFTPIPTFGGTFLGQGHTVSGLRVTAAGSAMGLFRYLQPAGVVRDLTVKGTVSPAGARTAVGGIAGENAGLLENCTFRGVVRGVSAVGGIAGRSSESGQIVRCTAAGSVSGESATGGIVGRSAGVVLFCENLSGVNLTEGDTSADFRVSQAGSVLEERAAADEETYRLLTSCSDTGGIAGYSIGEIQNSTNRGAVGYPHVGYNTGGIAGRSSGYISQCVNTGTILGRKDVGGIVGQAEPCVLIDPGRDTIEELRRELNTLEGLINRALDNASRTGDDVSGRLTLMGDYAVDARDSSSDMLRRLADFTDETVDSANTLLSDITDALNRLSPALDDLSEAGRRLERLSRQLGEAMDNLEDASAIGADILQELRDALNGLQRAGSRLTGASRALDAAMEDLVLGAVSSDQETVSQAAAQLETALSDLSGSFSDAAGAAGGLGDALSRADLPPQSQLLPALNDAEQALDDIAGAVEDLPAPPDVTLPDIQDGILDELLEKITQAGENLETALAAIQKALSRSDSFTDKLGDALGNLQGASSTSAAIGRLIHSAFRTAGSAVDRLTGDGPVQFNPLGEEFREASDGLYAAMVGLFDEMEGLNGILQEGNHTLTADLRAVNRQCNVVFDLLLTAMDDLAEDAEQGLDAVIEDTSEEDIAAVRAGKITGCHSIGAVEGDRNVGGIAGAVAIELEVDPEDDTADRFSFGSTYETKAVLEDCQSDAAVTAKKDCAGGAAGRMDLGTAIGCQNYGPVESTGGDYTGGIAGYAEASLRSCYAKCALNGKSYVGGIAGWASRIQGCYAIVTIEQGDEYLGAIAGSVDGEGVLRDNFFVDTGLAGLDGVSYAGRAEPIPFDTLETLPDTPAAFTAFSLTLLAEGKVVAKLPLLYGANLPEPQLPPVPEVPGCYGLWPDLDTSDVRADITLEAVYTPWLTVVASEAYSGKLSLALAEGQFTDQARLQVASSAQTPPGDTDGCAVWDVSLTGTDLRDSDKVPLRLLNPTGKTAVLWQYRDGVWQAVETAENGQYLLLTMEGTAGTFCIQPQSPNLLPLLLSGAGIALLALLAAAILRRKKKRTAQKAAVKAK